MSELDRDDLKQSFADNLETGGANTVAEVRAELDNIADSAFIKDSDTLDDVSEGVTNIHFTQEDRNNILSGSDVTQITGVPSLLRFSAIPEFQQTSFSYSRAADATRVNRLGFLETVGHNILRHQYDPDTYEYLGWLTEGATTNILKHSADMSDASAWTQFDNGGTDWWTISRTDEVSTPSGTGDATKFVSKVEQGHITRQSNTYPAGQRTTSVWIYVPTQVGINNFRLNTDYSDVWGSPSPVVAVFDRWVRLSMLSNLLGEGSWLDLNIQANSTNPPIGFTFYTWNAQDEAGPFATSDIVTGASAGPRAEDLVLADISGFVEKTIYWEGAVLDVGEWPAMNILGALSGTGEMLRIQAYGDDLSIASVYYDGIENREIRTPPNVFVYGEPIKVAITLVKDTLTLSVNGVDYSVALPIAPAETTPLRIGGLGSDIPTMRTLHRDVAVFPPLNKDQLNAMTKVS